MDSLTRLGAAVAILGTLSAIIWAAYDHIHVVEKPTSTVTVSNRPIGTITTPGNGNIVNNSGTVTINNGRTVAASEKEAARQRLHDSGIDYDSDRFASALTDREVDIIDLFTSAGMHMSVSDLSSFVGRYDPVIADILLKADQSSACPTDAYGTLWYATLQDPALSFVKKVCGTSAVRARLRGTLQSTQTALLNARQADESAKVQAQRSFEICEQAYMEAFRSRATRQAAQEDCMYRHAGDFKTSAPAVEQKMPKFEEALRILGG